MYEYIWMNAAPPNDGVDFRQRLHIDAELNARSLITIDGLSYKIRRIQGNHNNLLFLDPIETTFTPKPTALRAGPLY